MTLTKNELPNLGQSSVPIRVGFYGNTGAGKTRWLYEFIRNLNVSPNGVNLSGKSQEYYEQIGEALEKGNIPETDKDRDDIQISIRNNFLSDVQLITTKLPAKEFIPLQFTDINGKQLRQTVLGASVSGSKEQTELARLLTSCDVLLFFFDPTTADGHDAAKVADILTGLLPSMRGYGKSNVLPILFIQTHKDQFKADWNPDGWFDTVIKQMRENYKKEYGEKVFKNISHDIFDKKNHFIVDSTQPDKSFNVLKRICLLMDKGLIKVPVSAPTSLKTLVKSLVQIKCSLPLRIAFARLGVIHQNLQKYGFKGSPIQAVFMLVIILSLLLFFMS